MSWSQFDPGKVITPNFIAACLKIVQQMYVLLVEYRAKKSDAVKHSNYGL